REAIAAASQNGETILFAASLTSGGPAVIQLTNTGHVGEIAIKKNITINGPGADLLTGKAFDPTPDTKNGDGSRVFNFDDGNVALQRSVTIRNLALTGGDVGDANIGGGAILNRENLTAEGLRVEGNSAVAFGGGIASVQGNLVLADCSINNNS